MTSSKKSKGICRYFGGDLKLACHVGQLRRKARMGRGAASRWAAEAGRRVIQSLRGEVLTLRRKYRITMRCRIASWQIDDNKIAIIRERIPEFKLPPFALLGVIGRPSMSEMVAGHSSGPQKRP